MIRQLPLGRVGTKARSVVACDHRSVSNDGRIICRKIAEGDAGVSTDLCHGCPYRATNCEHLRFSLLKTSPSPLVVRHNGRTELWDDDPPALHFLQAACAVKVLSIDSPRSCTGCVLRKCVQTFDQAEPQAGLAVPAVRRATPRRGRVVTLPRGVSVPAVVPA